MVLVLVGATLISGLLGEYLDAITIVAIIVMNGILGFVQEFRAERSLRALKELSAPTAKVVREAASCRYPRARCLCRVISFCLKSGDRIPADIRFSGDEQCVCRGVGANGRIRTGEQADGADCGIGRAARRSAQSRISGHDGTRGTAKGIVVRYGHEYGNGQNRRSDSNRRNAMDTPLQHRLEQLGKILIIVAMALTVMVVVAGILHGQPAYGMFLAGVSLAVAAIPEGLPAIVTIALALGVQRMIKRKAIVRKLPSVETLGCASVICSDKTGTLTQNKMTVTHLWVGGMQHAK